MHKQGVVHCDVKPANILISAQWVAKVADFGHSWEINQDPDTKDGQFRGTPPYMAPEVVISAVYDATVDVWSYGCVLAHVS